MGSFAALGNKLYTGEKSYDIVGRQRTWYAISAVILLVSFGALGLRGLTLGLEFTGGSEFRVSGARTTSDIPGSDAVQSVVPSAVPKVAAVGNESVRVQTDKLSDEQTDQVRTALARAYGVQVDDVTASFVGPSWGKTVSQKALTGLLVFLALVAVVISAYFRTWKMAVAALVALLHDLVITVGLYALIGFEVTPASVIGFLTILGYSLYDTVVVFDKVRENTAGITGQTRKTYSEAANLALNQTLVRSLNTSVVALLPVGAILFIGAFLLGAGTLKDLSLALFVGIAAGTYSSVFIATPLLADLREREPEMKVLRRRVLAKRAEAAGGTPAAASARPRRGQRAGTGTAVLDRPGDAAGEEPESTGDSVPTSTPSSGATAARNATSGGGAPRRRGAGPRNQPRRGGPRSKRR
jgi:preprotein translocase subunit SecF